jgi:hypothetical protein
MIRKLLFTLAFLCLCAASSHAATITVQSTTISGFNGVASATYEVWVFSDSAWTDVGGFGHGAGSPNDKVFTQRITGLSYNNTTKVLTIPSVQLTSTTDALVNPNVRLRVWIMQVAGANATPIKPYPNTENGIKVPPTIASVSGCSPLGTCCVWLDLIYASQNLPPSPPPRFTYSDAQIDAKFSANAGVTSSRTINTTAPLTGGGNLASDLTVAMAKATALVDGYLAAADFTTFNNKLSSNGNGSSLTNLNASALASGTVADARLSGNVPLLNAAVNAFTGRLTSNVTPVFDLASGALSADFLISHASVSIGASKTFSAIRLGQSDGSSNTFTAGAGSVVSNIGSFARALSGSDATSNLYATVIQAENAGPGTVKSLHLLSSGVAGSTGALAAASFDVAPVTGQGPTFVIQVASSGVNNIARGLIFTTNGGNFDYGIDFVGYSTIPSYASAALRLSNNAVVAARAADNSANINLFKCNTSNEFEILTTALVLNQANPYIQVGSTAAGWLFQKVDSDNHWRMFKQGFGEVLALQGTNPSDGSTAMSLLVTKGGVTSLVQVGVGAADSGGTGKRALTVSN